MKNKKLATVAIAAVTATTIIATAACGGGQQLNFGKEALALDSQLNTLVQLDNGAIDVSVIDSVMAGYYTATGAYKDKIQTIDGLVLAQEEYGIAGRKEDKAFVSKINEALIALADTDYKTVAEQFGVTSSLSVTATTANPLANEDDNSWNEIVSSGKIVIGYTVFAPIAYTENDVLTGFDIELAKKVVAYLNTTYSVALTLDFQEINWDSKEALLDGGSIDLIWNGMTITEERSANMCISVPYLYNKQVAVIRKEDAEKYKTTDDMAEAIIGFEAGSAGEDVVIKK